MKRNHGLIRAETYTADKDAVPEALVCDMVDQNHLQSDGKWPVGLAITRFEILGYDGSSGVGGQSHDVPLKDGPTYYQGDIYQNEAAFLRIHVSGTTATGATTGNTIYWELDLGSVTLAELVGITQTNGSFQPTSAGYYDFPLGIRFSGRREDIGFYINFYSDYVAGSPVGLIQGLILNIKGIVIEVSIVRTSTIDPTAIIQPSQSLLYGGAPYNLNEGSTYRYSFRIINLMHNRYGTRISDIPLSFYYDPAHQPGVPNTFNEATDLYNTVAPNQTIVVVDTAYPNTAGIVYDGAVRPCWQKDWEFTVLADFLTESASEIWTPTWRLYYQGLDYTYPTQWNPMLATFNGADTDIGYHVHTVDERSTTDAGTLVSSTYNTSVSEGSTQTVTVTFAGDAALDTTAYFKFVHGGTSDADFNPISPSIQLFSGDVYYPVVSTLVGTERQYVFTYTVTGDSAAESTETFNIEAYKRTGDGNDFSLIFGSNTIDLLNVSPNPTTAFIPVPLNILSAPYSSDWSGAYDVHSLTLPSTGMNSAKRIYVGIKVVCPTTYYNDVCIAAVQIIAPPSSGSFVRSGWSFANNSSLGWETTTSSGISRPTIGSAPTLASVAALSHSNITGSAGVNQMSLASGTSSSTTGMMDGIASSYSNAALPQNGGTVNQSSSTYYIYRETSGSARYSMVFMRSPLSYMANGDEIRIAAKFVTNAGQITSIDPSDVLYIGVA